MTLSLKMKFGLAAILALLTMVFGALRLDQLVIRQSPSELQFGPTLNNVTWNAATGELSRTGGDPYAFLQIPSDSQPLDELVLECRGTPIGGASFVYPSPYYLPHTDIDDRLAVQGKIETTSHGYRIRFPLGGSKIVRLDLSDDLPTPIVISEAVFHTRFLVGTNSTFRVFATCLGAFLLTLFWIVVGPIINRFHAAEIGAVILLVSLKLWLSGDMHMTIYADARHDDALFLSQGHSIANGDWLGKFGELTLAKGPSYSVFIGLVQLSRIPLLDAQAIFHALACVLFILAVRPLVRSPGIRLLLLAVLLFDPHPFSSEAGERALRSSIQPALTLMTLAGVIGMGARLSGRARILLPWSVLGGVALAFFWFSREEGIWLVPTLTLISGGSLWLTWSSADGNRGFRAVYLLLPFVIWFSALWTLRAVNYHYYGAWISVDAKDGGFPNAYGALTRIKPAAGISGVPVTKETRLRAYAVSPAFAELQKSLDRPMGNPWARHGWEQLQNHPSAGQEIRGGWFGWALREAAYQNGYYRDALKTSDYWQRVADEINAACEDGRLAAGGQRSGFFPRWDSSYWAPMGPALAGAAAIVVRFSDYKAQTYPSRGDSRDVGKFSRVIHETPVMEWLPPSFRTHLRIVLFHCYQNLGWPASIFAVVATFLLAVKRQPLSARLIPLMILLGLLGGATALMIIVALVDVTSFSALHAMYLAPATPLVLSASILAPYWALISPRLRPSVTGD